jgi:alkylation response protein AidB-like acyl-CoA dehydrogenase
VLCHAWHEQRLSTTHDVTVASHNRLVDIVGSASAELPHVAALIDEVLAPAANHVDRHGVQRVALDHLADAGLLGTALPIPEQRELAELIARTDASTWFCWVQHQTPLTILRDFATPEAAARYAEVLDGLASGEMISGVAFAHVRRPGHPNPAATRVEGGWSVTGTLDWVTSWDIADVVLVLVAAESSLISFFLTAGEVPSLREGVTVGEPLRLLAMTGTHTRPIRLDSVFVPDDEIVAILDGHAWKAADSIKTANANPAIFGIARGAISELDDLATAREDSRIRALVTKLAAECVDIRARAYAAIDGEANVDTRLRLRAEALDHLMRACLSVVTARAGASMIEGCSAERRVREALFMQVQAQTAATRAAMQELALER